MSSPGSQLDPLRTLKGVDDPVAEVDVILVVVLCVVVGDEDVDVEPVQVDLTNANALGSVPVAVKQLRTKKSKHKKVNILFALIIGT